MGHFHDTHLGMTVSINSSSQGQHLLIKERKPSPTPGSTWEHSTAGRVDSGRYRSPGDIAKDYRSEKLDWLQPLLFKMECCDLGG